MTHAKRLLPIAICLVLALAATWPVFQRIDYWGRGDWDQHFFYQAVPRRTLLEYGQWPLWNPWYCGGMVMLANPQSRFLSPTFLFVLAAGVVPGVKIEITIHYAICLLGAFVLCRQLGLARAAAFAGAAVYALCTMHSEGLAEGMTWLLACAYVPWAVVFFMRALRDWRWCVACAIALALMFFNGGAYPLALTCLALGIYAACEGATRAAKTMRVGPGLRPLALLAATWALMLLLGAVKFFPSLAYMHAHPRRLLDESGYTPANLARSLVDWRTGMELGKWPGATWSREENASYVGAVALALAAVGLVVRGRREWKLVVLLAVFGWLSLGQLVPLSLWAGLHEFPVFGSMRVAQRARLVGVLALGAFAGAGVDAVLRRGRWGRLVGGALAATVMGELAAVNGVIFARTFVVPPVKPKVWRDFCQISKLDDVDSSRYVDNLAPLAKRTLSMLYPAFLCNIGTVDALESAATRRRALSINRPGYRGEAFALEGSGHVLLDSWTPNRVEVTAVMDGPGVVALNQNYVRGWRASGGASGAQWFRGFVGCRVRGGRSVVTFTYEPASAVWGAWISAASILALLAAWVATRRRWSGAQA